MLLGNAIVDFHGGPVLLGNFIAGGQTHCNGGLQVALGRKWWRGVFRECHCRLVALCYWGMPVEVPKRIVMVGSRG